MKDLEVITINDNDYFIINEVKKDGISYLYLSNVNDEEDTLIRKTKKNDPDTILPLENEQEFEIACNLLLQYIIN